MSGDGVINNCQGPCLPQQLVDSKGESRSACIGSTEGLFSPLPVEIDGGTNAEFQTSGTSCLWKPGKFCF